MTILVPNLEYFIDFKSKLYFEMSDKEKKHPTKILSVMANLRSPVGRKTDFIWNNFSTERDPNTNKVTSNICNRCSKQISAQPCRMRKHLAKCIGLQDVLPPPLPVVTQHRLPMPPAPSLFIPIVKKQKTLKAVETLAVSTALENNQVQCLDINLFKPTKKVKDSVDVSLGKLIFGLNLPYNIVEHSLLTEFFKLLRPTYSIPSKEMLATTILDQIYEERTALKAEELKGKKVTIWQEVCNNSDAVIMHYLSTGYKTYFIDAIPTNMDTNIAIYCLSVLEVGIDKAEEELGCKVIAAVADNSDATSSMCWHLQVKRPEMLVFGCHVQMLNGLGQDLMATDIIDSVTTVQKYFRDHQFGHDALLEMNGTKPVLTCSPNWRSQLDCFQSFMENHSKYIEITCLPNILKDDHVIAILSDTNLYNNVVKTVKKMEPIATAIDKIQSGGAILSDAIRQWMNLEEIKELASDSMFQAKKQMAMSPVGIAAYMLHPVYRGKGLTSVQDSLGYEFLEAKNPVYVAAAINLQQSNSNFFPGSHLNMAVIQHLTPTVWWRSLEKFSNISGDLVEFGENLMSLPASTADPERHTPTIENIFHTNCNQLGIDKVQKLCSIYHSYTTDSKYKNQNI